MTKHHHHHPFPRLLLSIRNLPGGQYGTLDVTARAEDTVELALGGSGDFVWLRPVQWKALRGAIDALFCFDDDVVDTTVVVTTTPEGGATVIEVVEECEPGERRRDPIPRPRPPRPGSPPESR
jgi:hypothetical protein